MGTMLLVEALLVCVVALPVGRGMWRARGATSRLSKELPGFVLLIFSTLALTGLFWYLVGHEALPLQQLDPFALRYERDCLGGIVLTLEVGVWLTLVVGALGYLLGGLPSMASALLALGGMMGGALCLAAIAGRIPLVGLDVLVLGVGVWLLGLLGVSYIGWRGRARSISPLAWSWTAFYGLTVLLAFVIGRLGVWLILLPAVLVFCWLLYVYSGLLLPIETAQDHWQAWRSLLTFALGTNFPFYVIEDWHTRDRHEETLPQPRVAGDPYRRFFSGPGIILNDAAHAAVLWDSLQYRVAPPGLNFTRPFEQVFAAVDLRPQLRNATIEAETADGIVTHTLVFMPQRIAMGQQPLQLGASYPYAEDAVLRAVCDNAFLQHHFTRQENLAEEKLEPISWDSLAQMLAPPILREVILARRCDELHESGTARVEIAQEFVRRLREQLAQVGITLVGGGISNIKVPPEIIEQRLASWEAKWQRDIEARMGEEEAEILKKLDPIWMEAQLDVYTELARILKQASDLDLDLDTIALQLVDALGTMPMKQKNVQDLPTFMWMLMRQGRMQEGGDGNEEA